MSVQPAPSSAPETIRDRFAQAAAAAYLIALYQMIGATAGQLTPRERTERIQAERARIPREAYAFADQMLEARHGSSAQ